MCNCDSCNNQRQDYTVLLWQTDRPYNGSVPISIIQVLDKNYNPLTPAQVEASADLRPLNAEGYVKNYFALQFFDPDRIFITKTDTLHKTTTKAFAVILVYNNTN